MQTPRPSVFTRPAGTCHPNRQELGMTMRSIIPNLVRVSELVVAATLATATAIIMLATITAIMLVLS